MNTARVAAIDVGTNTVQLVVAEPGPEGRLAAVVEREEITRLGEGVDRTGALSAEAIARTVSVLRSFASEARSLGAERISAAATSAARDATNRAALIDRAFDEAGVRLEILPGEREAELSFRAASADFGPGPLAVLDIGGGSTEVIYGAGQTIDFHQSYDIGSVRLTERHFAHDPPTDAERARLSAQVGQALASVPPRPARSGVVGLAGTVTTLCAVARGIHPFEPARVQGAVLSRADLANVTNALFLLPLEARRQMPGLPPKRADVICAGAVILSALLDRLGASECRVSDRGLRWGLLLDSVMA